MSLLGARIKAVRTNVGKNQTEFAVYLGVTQTMVSRYEKEEAAPDHHTLLKIAEMGNVSLDWLLTGSESTFKPPMVDPKKVVSNVKPAIGNWYPVVAKVTAGDRQILEDNVEGEVFMEYHKKNGCFAVIVEGNSMDGGDYPICEGDCVLWIKRSVVRVHSVVLLVSPCKLILCKGFLFAYFCAKTVLDIVFDIISKNPIP